MYWCITCCDFETKSEHKNTRKQIFRKVNARSCQVSLNDTVQIFQLKLLNVHRKLCELDTSSDSLADGKPDDSEPVTYCLQALLATEVLLNPSSDTQIFVNELLMVQRLKVMSLGFWL
jgi:hypothetical protein